METAMSIIIVIAAIVCMCYLKGTFRIFGSHVKDIVETNVSEDKEELIERSMEAYERIIDKYGQDFKTPTEIYDLITKKRNKKQNVQQA